MSTSTIDHDTESATPVTSWVASDNVQEIIDSFDDDMARLQEKEVNGQFVKTTVVFDVLLDVRNKLANLI